MTASQLPVGPLHPAQRRYLAEDLVRRRRSDEQRRYSAPQRAAKIDANPHQVDAVIFALARAREGGCILADEVGLGKTIEAGLVIAQLMAEGARRILLLAPKPLLGQWKQELFQLFDIVGVEAQAREGAFDGDGVFLIGREAAGSERGRDALLAARPFDLCVIDEAHEVFAGIYKRFNRWGDYQEDSPHARTAGRVREVLSVNRTPVLLLTATPIQNSLSELWGLVQFVDPLGTLLGDLPTFREVFCGVDDRQLAPGQDEELRNRLRVVLQRTLRRQAQDFLEQPFVGREARLFDYAMSPAEKALYDDVTRYLLEPGILAFPGTHRQLLLLGFHRRMASSTRALAASLEGVARRLRRKGTSADTAEAELEDARDMVDDLEGEGFESSDDERASSDPLKSTADSGALAGELTRVESFIQRAKALGSDDGKLRALLKALEFVTSRGRDGKGAGKLVVFTESLVTQEYLRARLIESRFVSDEEVTLFRGTNDSPRARQALARWLEEVPQDGATKASPEIATRLALVHEFKSRSKIFISTEAGAKGLNLQFADTVVNYDLPWNPQRIEQRIGRCHRYGQRHDVTVINFLAKDNEAQALTFEILSQKLELFGTVLDASDQVLHRSEGPGAGVLVSAVGAEFEAELRRIYDRARTLEEVATELRELRDRVGEQRRRFEETHQRVADLIEQRLDEGVQSVFRSHREAVPRALAELDRDLTSVVISFLDAREIGYERLQVEAEDLLRVDASPALPVDIRGGVTVAIGPSKARSSLHLRHPLVLAALDDARTSPLRFVVAVRLRESMGMELRRYEGRAARLRLVRLAFDGFERVERLVPVVVVDGGEILEPRLGDVLLRSELRATSTDRAAAVTDVMLEDATQEVLFAEQASVDEDEQRRFERAVEQANRFVEDRLLVLRRRHAAAVERLEQARARRDAASGSEARTDADRAVLAAETTVDEIEGAVARLERRDDKAYRTYQDHIEKRRYAPPTVEHVFDLDLVIG